MPTKTSQPYYAQSDIATRLGVPAWRVRYILSSRKIAAATQAGSRRLFDADAVAQVERVLQQIAWRRRRSNLQTATA